MKNKFNAILVFILFGLLFFSFSQVLLKGYLPIPADTIVGLYHPFRDLYADNYPNGIPFKNFLITDPVRQIYPWKHLSIYLLKQLQFPLWNPYEMAGKPHLANFQSAAFYPLNIFLFPKPFIFGWSIFIISQLILLPLFMYLYLKNLNLSIPSVVLGTISFSFSGFAVSWFEWGNLLHTAMWLPLILLCIDKIFHIYCSDLNERLKPSTPSALLRTGSLKARSQKSKLYFKNKKLLIWLGTLLFTSISSFFAGHLQIFFYISIVSVAYFVFRWFEYKKILNILFLFSIFFVLFLIATSPQWFPTLQFISLSARSLDQSYLEIEGWFIPWQHLVQFLAPDFFGNPTTLNYWGTWNYAELVGYIGVTAFILALFAIFARRDKKTVFFAAALIVSLIFSLPTFFAKIPYILNIPFLSSSQPTRLLVVSSFSLSVLSALGFDYLLRTIKIRKLIISILFVGVLFSAIWIFVIFQNSFNINSENLLVSKRNLILPSLIFLLSSLLFLLLVVAKNELFKKAIIAFLLIIVAFDAYRFFTKFEPFTKKEYLFPKTKVIEFLQKDKSIFRIASADSRIFPPNFSTIYKLQSIEGYDPLYLYNYAAFIAAVERGEPNIKPPFGFNRIITPHNVESKFFDLLNVKYVLSLEDLSSEHFTKLFQEGQTKIYENKNYMNRTFFVPNIIYAQEEKEIIEKMFETDLTKYAVVSSSNRFGPIATGEAEIINYTENEIVIDTNNRSNGFLVLTDTYYPTWRATVDGKNTKIYKTNFTFRGIFVPKGEHIVKFYNTFF